MKDEPLDIIPMIVLLGLVVAISMSLIIPMYRDAQMLKYDVLYDKSVTSIEGGSEDIINIKDGFTAAEVSLMVGGQSYFMPHPRIVDVCGTKLEIQPDAQSVDKVFDPNAGNAVDPDAPVGPDEGGAGDPDPGPDPGAGGTHGEEFTPKTYETYVRVRNLINEWYIAYKAASSDANASNLKFDIRFTTGDLETDDDDCYAVCVLGKDEFGKIRYLKCKSGGLIDNPKNYPLEYFN